MEEKEKYYTFELDNKTIDVKPTVISDKFTGITHSDFLDRPAVNTINLAQPKQYIRCPHCGELAELAPEVYTSMPPQYKYTCSHCGKSGFIYCHDAHIIYDNDQKNPWNYEGIFKSQYETKCIICGDTLFADAIGSTNAHVCEKCRKAILKLRKMLEEDND